MSQPKNKSRLQEALDKFKQEFDPTNYADEYLERFKKQIKQHEPNERDKKLGNKLRSIVHRYREEHPGEVTYFNFDFIEQLGLGKLDLLFIYTGKNTGKTYALGKLATQTLYDYPSSKIFYLRTLRDHLERGFAAQNQEDNGPGEGSRTTGELTLKKNSFIVQEGRRPKGDLVGWATYLSGDGTVSFQGPSYNGLKYLFGDECNCTGEINEKMLRAFFIFVLSLERNNNDFRIIMTGNLLTKDSGVANNIILDYLGIPIETKLKYMEIESVEGQPPYKILYINAGHPGELFDGTDTQRNTALFKLANKEWLIDNEPLDMSNKVVTVNSFLDADKLYSVVVPAKYDGTEAYGVLYIGAIKLRDGMQLKDYWIMHIEQFESDYQIPGYKLLTDDKVCSNLFGKTHFVRSEQIANIGRHLSTMLDARRVFFSNSETRHIFQTKLYKQLMKKYQAMLDEKGVFF